MKWCMRKNKAELNCRCVGQKGFTLVEIMVSVAILAIMSGLMVPMVYKVWESNEKTETREKMAELKRAMVGDQRMVQNGIRMHYGFVGDNGELPTVIADLVNNSGSFANWHGPYLVGAFDPNDYSRDAWGRNLVYTRHAPAISAGGQEIVATLASLGPDGLAGTSDDLDEISDPELQILESEVWPTDKVQGNLDYVFTAATTTPIGTLLYSRLYVIYNVPATPGFDIAESSCFQVTVGEVLAGESKRVRQPFFQGVSAVLPVGRVTVGSHLYVAADCSGTPVPQTNEVVVYVSEGLSAVAVNLPTINFAVP